MAIARELPTAEDHVNQVLSSFIAGLFTPGVQLHAASVLKDCRIVPEEIHPIPRRWGKPEEAQLDDEDFDRPTGQGQPLPKEPEHDSGTFLKSAMARLRLNNGVIDSDISARIGTKNEILQEKKAVKYELKRHDTEFRAVHFRMPTRAEKEPLRPLYMYYRKLKQSLEKEHGTGAQKGASDDEEDQAVGDEGTANAESAQLLLEQRMRALQEEKNSVRSKLQKFQERFVAENHRKIRYHKDIVPIERDYRMYKQVKDDIAKLESQLRELRAAQGQ
jgi:hypothetical protein